MKRLSLLYAFILLPLLSIAHHEISHHGLSGTWINNTYGQKIVIESARNGILVYGVNQNPIYFRHVSNRKFKSDCRSSIRIQNDQKITFYDRSRGLHTNFYKRFDDRRNGGCYPAPERRRSMNRNSNYQLHEQNGFTTSGDPYSLGSFLEGTWFCEQIASEVLILNDRGKLKVKIKGQQDWIHFTPVNYGAYTDEKGNAYQYTANGQLIWTNGQDNSNTFILDKRSDAINW